MRVGVATIQRGRHAHLARQGAHLARLARPPDRYVVVSMDDDPVEVPGARVVHLPAAAPLPLAGARNAAVAALGDVDLAVLLDVDCLPGDGLLTRYAAAARERPGALLAGPVGYLAPGAPEGAALTEDEARAARVPGARPVPPPGELRDEPRSELFWTLSFAVTPATHARIGGFDEGYAGYGAEDTDYAVRARERGVGLVWVGGAWAFHQHHPTSHPPVQHLDDIVRNATRFHRRHGRWPMEGWLRAFAEQGLVVWEDDRLERTLDAEPARRR